MRQCAHTSFKIQLLTEQRTSRGVPTFLAVIFWYFSAFVLALRPCHGNRPCMKNMRMYDRDSQSSLRLISLPWWQLMLAYRGVPVRRLPSRKGMCCCVLGSQYILERPKSITNTRFSSSLPGRPMRKLAGLMSRWTKFFLCKCSMIETNWSAS